MAVMRDRPYLDGNFRVDPGTGNADDVQGGFVEVVLSAAAIDAIEEIVLAFERMEME